MSNNNIKYYAHDVWVGWSSQEVSNTLNDNGNIMFCCSASGKHAFIIILYIQIAVKLCWIATDYFVNQFSQAMILYFLVESKTERSLNSHMSKA